MLKDTGRNAAQELAEKAENLYRSRQHLCADSMLMTFNDALDGGLSEQQAVGLTTGLSLGQGGSGCLCGAVASGSLVLGLFLADGNAYGNFKEIQAAVHELQERFTFANKSTCCRVLTRKVKDDKKAHFNQCAGFTGQAAYIVAEILFAKRPELLERMDKDYVAGRDSTAKGIFRRVLNKLFR